MAINTAWVPRNNFSITERVGILSQFVGLFILGNNKWFVYTFFFFQTECVHLKSICVVLLFTHISSFYVV